MWRGQEVGNNPRKNKGNEDEDIKLSPCRILSTATMANPKWHHCVLHPMNVDPRKNMKKSSLKSSRKPSLTCSPLGLSLPSCKKAKCLGVSGFSGLSAFPFVSRLDTMGPTMDIWREKRSRRLGIWHQFSVKPTYFCICSLLKWIMGSKPLFGLLSVVGKDKMLQVFFEQIQNKILTTQIGSCSTKNLKRPENIRKPSTQKLQCPKKWIHVLVIKSRPKARLSANHLLGTGIRLVGQQSRQLLIHAFEPGTDGTMETMEVDDRVFTQLRCFRSNRVGKLLRLCVGFRLTQISSRFVNRHSKSRHKSS